MTNNVNLIPIDEAIDEFGEYLKLNSRCILSAKFGDGKSYFLSQFMKKKEKKYLFIPIYPVNYQIADNKDIFEYIKRDILIRLLMSPDIEIDDTQINENILLLNYLTSNTKNILMDTLEMLPTINICGMSFDLPKMVNVLKTLEKKYKEHSEKFEPDEKKITDFIEKVSKVKGSIYEFDFISQLICLLNDNYRKKYKNRREIVLVIEDLDRIDPAHIFRILNIFSAHFDWFSMPSAKFQEQYYMNKFRFDKIITVCDYENIKHIYSHFYGPQTDFEGYISKYASTFPYKYSLRNSIQEHILKNLHRELTKNPNFSIAFSEAIAKRILNGKIKHNIRKLNEALTSEPLIRTENIFIQNLKPYYITSFNSITILLDLLRKLDISFNEIYPDIKNNLFQLINIGWLTISDNSNNLYLREDKLNGQFGIHLMVGHSYLFLEPYIKKTSSDNSDTIEITNFETDTIYTYPNVRGPLSEHIHTVINGFKKYLIHYKE